MLPFWAQVDWQNYTLVYWSAIPLAIKCSHDIVD
jgi:hypothetical protein